MRTRCHFLHPSRRRVVCNRPVELNDVVLVDFLYRLRSLVTVQAGRLDATGRLFAVDTLTFNESPLHFPQIQATLVIDAFVYGTGVPAASVPVTPTTTTTGETTTSSTTTTTAAASGASATGAP